MKKWGIIVFSFALIQGTAYGQQNLTIEEWLNIYIDSCVGSGSSFSASGSLDAGVGLSLKKMNADGSVTGQVKVEKSSYKLLTDGISNAMSAVAADQADKVRECLGPMRQNIFAAMQQDLGTGATTGGKKIYILSPQEEKVMKVLATTEGMNGEIGKRIKSGVVARAAGLSELRLKATMRSLQEKVLAAMTTDLEFIGQPGAEMTTKQIESVSLWDNGEDYVLSMGYAQ